MKPKNLVPRFFDGTAKSYDSVAKFATFGRDDFWKDQIIQQIPDAENILELACGTGILTGLIAKRLPHCKIIGVDITQNYLEVARKKLGSHQNISFVCQDAETLELGQKFDCIVSSYIPKYCNAQVLVPNCIKHLKSNGKIILHDFTFPQNRTIQLFWDLHFTMLRMVGNIIPEWKEAFSELPKLIQHSTWVHDYKSELEKNGFVVTIQYHTWNCCAILIGTRPKNNIL